MARVIFFSVDLHGHVNPSLGLIEKLIEKGEEVIYYSSDQFREKVEGTGAEFKSYEGLLGFGTYDGYGIDTFLIFADFILGKSRTIFDRFLDEVKALKPDYIIHDAFSHWGREYARTLGIPAVSIFANFAFIDEMAKIDPGFFMENILRAADDPIYKKYKGNPEICTKLLEKLSKSISTKYGFKNMNVLDDIFCSKEGLNILLTSKTFQLYSEAFDSSYLFTGYHICQRTELDDFPYEKLDGRPLVFIAFGTIYNELVDIYKNCFEAFGNTDKQVVLSVGNKIAMEDLGDIPENFIVRRYVSQLEILKRSDVFITHAGANSVYESLCFNVPLVVVPQVFDEFLGAIMVEQAGVGVYIRDRAPSASELTEAVHKVLTETTYKDNCKRIRESFEAAGGLEYAVGEIFKFVAK